ncbi:COX assembly mitochondrial protein homolog [Amyelois transitella]|uniref:COX assembly mitochondrial protein homolog n=1 Tax=Amyelois transitella TaxID=680683 RepID=UPI00298F51BF|nr:COX assembly mitochondrial protein homolog [Amyelois transitella]
MTTEKAVLSPKFSAGPHGLGDPEDRSLRKVEIEVLIPKLMREKAKTEKCTEQVRAFEKCCKESSLLMVVTCRKQNAAMKDCLTNWYRNDEFRNICTEEYLKKRSEYRQTGIKNPIKRA